MSLNDGTPSGGSYVYSMPFTHSSTVTLPRSVRISVEWVKDGPLDFGTRPVFACRILRGGQVIAENRGVGYASCSASLN
ncbi:hypothetical protein [Segniliparus rugosus]|uniref:Uncharacterized protein n=1 Tax=Segniliparus rugosus (strain ATCC BAA-974 / DSM 45345 / CCUG 50838 / CIP 108380 / JCM 13579 / CDC 945) TaxID=679197 RepID=E5XT79_SEGRC|nr:hypothetical protein [Segniliparus rugosus]EFV12410.1 hypothetical protein HMPREF9336_02701 [Segniliparus rugosus ATCC BAA-974]